MAEGRFVSKSISTDYELNCSVSLEADYLFGKCIPHLDRDGRMTGHPGQVKATAVPLRAEMTLEVVDECLGELAAAGLVLWYQVEGKPALWFKGFGPHNKGIRYDREAPSKLPAPNHPQLQRLTTLVREYSGSTPAHSRGEERRVEESRVSKPPAVLDSPREDGRQAGSGLEALIAYVGEEHRDSVQTVAAMPGTGSAWARGVLATWGPKGSMEGNMVPAAMRGEAVGLAIERYATDRGRWYGPGFKAFVCRAYADILEHRKAAEKAAAAGDGYAATWAAALAREEEAKRKLEAEAAEHGFSAEDPSALVRSLTERLSRKSGGSS